MTASIPNSAPSVLRSRHTGPKLRSPGERRGLEGVPPKQRKRKECDPNKFSFLSAAFAVFDNACHVASCSSRQECIPDGSGASISMVSARFDGSAMEAKFRKVHELLTKHKFEVLMVDADAGDDFGDLTMEYLHRVEHEKGVMLAVCTAHYGEMTASKFSSHEEVKYARNQGLQVIPLRVVDTYPPEPPFGENHPHDKKGRARGYINAIFPPSKVFLDCRDKTAEQVAAMIGRRLLASRSKGHGSA